MKEKIFALLSEKFTGMRKDAMMQLARALALQCANDDDAKNAVDKLTTEQVNEYSKEFRADVDKEVSDSTKKFEANLKKKFDFVDKNAVEPGNGDVDKSKQTIDTNDIAAIVANAVAKAVEPLQNRINDYEGKNIADARLRSLNDTLATCKDESFKAQALKDFARMSFDNDDSFNEYLQEKASDIEGVNQRVADDALRNSGGIPLFTNRNKDGVSAAVQQFIDAKNSPNNKLAGKQV